MYLKELCLLLLVSAVLVSAKRDRNTKKHMVVCYVSSWANYRQGDGKFVMEDVDPKLCTHLIYAFAKLENNRIAPSNPHLDLRERSGLGAYERFNNLRRRNPHLSTMISIGGWNVSSLNFSRMASSPSNRSQFVRSAVDFCQKYNFDGMDVDWEYPANRGGAASDKKNFVTLLKELYNAFRPRGLLLSVAVSANKSTIDTGYDVAGVARNVDFINVMTYDFHNSSEKKAGHNAPLYARAADSLGDRALNVDFAINYWIKKGAPRNKLVLGMAFYGRSFTLASANSNSIGSPTNGPGSAGPLTRENGTLGYNEMCQNVKREWREVFVSRVEAPYAYYGRQWVGYDNKRSIEIKVAYLRNNKLGGAMIWSLDTDDFRGKCHGKKYPLLSTIASRLD